MKDIKHGTLSAYTNKNCRCEVCKKNWSDYGKNRKIQIGKKAQNSKPKSPVFVVDKNFDANWISNLGGLNKAKELLTSPRFGDSLKDELSKSIAVVEGTA